MTRPQSAQNENRRNLINGQYLQPPNGTLSRRNQPNGTAIDPQVTRSSIPHNGQLSLQPNGLNGTSANGVVRQQLSSQSSDRPLEKPSQLAGNQIRIPPRPGQVVRAKSDVGHDISPESPEDEPEQNWEIRHGWEDQYKSEEYLSLLSAVRKEIW